jgi:hypothetical protein
VCQLCGEVENRYTNQGKILETSYGKLKKSLEQHGKLWNIWTIMGKFLEKPAKILTTI